jgi:hypothetical protein
MQRWNDIVGTRLVSREKNVTALLRTCRRVYFEAVTPFYDNFNFWLNPGLAKPNHPFGMEAKVILPKMQHITVALRRNLKYHAECTDREDVERLCSLFEEYGRALRLMCVEIWTRDWSGKFRRSVVTSEMDVDLQELAADPAMGNMAASICKLARICREKANSTS